MISFLQSRVVTAKQFRKPDNIIIALPHFFPVNRDHVVMYPVTDRSYMIANGALRYLAFMMREQKIHAAAMNIKLSTQIFGRHGRAFNMPAGKTNTPGAFPSHNMFRCGVFP